MDLKGLMEKRLFGIPVLYLVIGFVLILAIVAYRMKPSIDEAATDDEGDPSEGNPTETGQPLFLANPPPVYSTPEPTEETESANTDDNQKWLRRAIEYIATSGIATADMATVALQKYLNGEQLSIAEGRIRDAAIKKIGLPPEIPTSGGTASPTPIPAPTKPTPKKYIAPAFHDVTGDTDNTYTKLAKLFYNRTDNASIDLIQSYNVSKPQKGPFKKGERFWIPAYHAPKYIKATTTMRTATDIIKKNPPLNSLKMLQSLNDGMTFPVKVGTRVRVA